ncbi:MAG: response regulator, partial [Mycobacteriales bacterium]
MSSDQSRAPGSATSAAPAAGSDFFPGAQPSFPPGQAAGADPFLPPAPGALGLPAGGPSATSDAGFTALVVDDHPLLRESIIGRLRTMGATQVFEAASIAEARARAQASGPLDLCVLDLGLPDGNGLDLLGELRGAGWSRLVVLSAADDPYSVRAAFVAGAQG